MKILWYCMDWSTKGGPNRYGGVGYYRVYTPAEALKGEKDVYGNDFNITICNENLADTDLDVGDFDIVVFKQATAIDILLPLVKEAKTKGVKLVMDLDDNYWHIEEHNPAYEHVFANDAERLRYFTTAITFCDAVITSTEPLKAEVERQMKHYDVHIPVYVLPNTVNVNTFTWQKPRKADDVKIMWMGSVTHDKDLEQIMEPLNELLNTHKNLTVHFAGGIRHEKVPEIFAKIDHKNIKRLGSFGGTPYWNHDKMTFPQFLSEHQFDIALAPLEDSVFNRSKSHIKWMESTTTGACVVASRVYPYYQPIKNRPTIEDGKTGVLVKDDWYNTLDKLIREPKKRRQLNREAVTSIHENWSIEAWKDEWKSVLNEIFNASLRLGR